MDEIIKRPFYPVRPAFTRLVSVPKTWICNVLKHHNPSRKVNDDSSDKMTIHFDCFCPKCIEIDEERYRYGRAVVVTSVQQEELNRTHVGIWFTRKGWALYKKELESR